MDSAELFIAAQPEGARLTRILIANRGEIASRIIRTCDILGIETVAIYTQQDSRAKFWRSATISYDAGDIETEGNVYLNAKRIIEIAKKLKADAIHPGYGYLSEQAEFAQGVIDSGLTWIGPKPETISILGDKAACKQFLRENTAGMVPLIPGVASRSQNPEFLFQEAEKIGYPILLKASAGGGGKGMRVVGSSTDFMSSLQMAKSEAKRSFGSDDMLLEKYIAKGKHVEVQMFGDDHGNCRIFGDRECSVQRRHQKVIEECPAVVSNELKQKMATAARAIAEATGYSNAATVEFIVDMVAQEAYFLEVNTRIQLYIAAGGNLAAIPDRQPRRHALELRLYAEDPYAGFIPQRGTVTLFQASKVSARYESSIQTGDEVSINFDPMIAKIIVTGSDRMDAIRKTKQVIASTVCLGLRTNQDFLGGCLTINSFLDASYTTSFIEENLAQLTKRAASEAEGAIIVSTFIRCLRTSVSEPSRLESKSTEWIITGTNQIYTVQKVFDRKATQGTFKLSLRLLNEESDQKDHSKALNVESARLVSRYYSSLSQEATELLVRLTDLKIRQQENYQIASAVIGINGTDIRALATIHETGDGIHTVHLDRYGTFIRKSGLVGFGELDVRMASGASVSKADYVAPMPGRVIRVEAKTGARVEEGQGILVLESMKTEVRILARTAGTVHILVKEGQVIDEGLLLAKVESEPE